ncbi:hypothetical protein M407DRAFT_241967 [Tulasnella calospora MUT 4182]|uniref:Thioesterase domain-containing protein n=1 Tax=Tulasnella calospora MUT 4182 TaxID=1051891 RepID=A0A0C3LB16_9AGAM|nr:hypothetical protein M407DRAFT_241967 [Tulasnella calospora MUT 4182]
MDVSDIAGNVSDDDKARIKGAILARNPEGSFAAWIAERLKLVKVETIQDDNAPSKSIYRVVHEIEACDEMDNGGGSVHGGCIAHLGSICSSSTFLLDSRWTGVQMTATLDVVYHSPIRSGDLVRIVSTSVAFGGRVATSRFEVWNRTRNALAASGLQVKRRPPNKSNL